MLESVTCISTYFSRRGHECCSEEKIQLLCLTHNSIFKTDKNEIYSFASVTVLPCNWVPPSDTFLWILMIFSCIINFNVYIPLTLKTCLTFLFRICRKDFWWMWRKYLECPWEYGAFPVYLIFSCALLLFPFIYSKLTKHKKYWNVLYIFIIFFLKLILMVTWR